MPILRHIYHRLAASRIRRRMSRDQLALDEYIATEQTRLHILDNRAEWHERQAKTTPPSRTALGQGLAALFPIQAPLPTPNQSAIRNPKSAIH